MEKYFSLKTKCGHVGKTIDLNAGAAQPSTPVFVISARIPGKDSEKSERLVLTQSFRCFSEVRTF